MFSNSPLLNPQEAYTNRGIGFYSVSKDFEKLTLTVGSFYDQFGSGLIFRAFEDRTIGLDYAIQGVRVRFTPNDSFMVKAFAGVQKFRFDVHPQVIKGANAEKIWGIGPFTFNSGAGITNRTLDQATIDLLANRINAMPESSRFDPKYNMYAGTLYNTLRYKNFSLYTEYAMKSKEAVYIEQSYGNLQLQNKGGKVLFGGLNYSRSGLGINLQYKKVEHFILRTSPDAQFNIGTIGYLPPLSKQQAYRLPARYGIAARDQGESGFQGDITYSPKEHNTFSLNGSYIKNPINQNKELYREMYLDFTKKYNKRLRTISGVQYIHYDLRFYQGEASGELVKAFTGFAEVSYKFDRTLRKSIRAELQYLATRQDLGDFGFALVEFNWAPHYSFSASDMVNVRPLKGREHLQYPTLFASYTYKQTRLTFGYIKQVQGVVCTGGVCRVEPAFSGVRFELSTNF